MNNTYKFGFGMLFLTSFLFGYKYNENKRLKSYNKQLEDDNKNLNYDNTIYVEFNKVKTLEKEYEDYKKIRRGTIDINLYNPSE